MGRSRLILSVLFLTVAMAASAAPVSAGRPPGALAIRLECGGPGPNGTLMPGQTDNCALNLIDGTLNAGSTIRVTVSSPAIQQLTCQQGVQDGNTCTFTVRSQMVFHGFIGGELIQFAGPGMVSATASCAQCGQFTFGVIGPGAIVSSGPQPRFFPTAPYAYKVCSGPNADGNVSETQVDTCLIYLTGGGGPFIAGDHLTIAHAAPWDVSVTSCSGSSVTVANAVGTANLCEFRFTTMVEGNGVFVGTEQIYIPSTVEPHTQINQVAFYCSASVPGLQRLCTDEAVPISVRGPGATVIDEIPPTFTFVPPDMTVDATGPTDTIVTYPSPSATDNAPGPVAIACAPASGAMFSVGTTVVTCTATDVSGNVATATFNVTAQNTPESLCRVTRLDVTKEGVAHSLCVKLDHGDFGAYINEVEAQSGKSMTEQQAADLEGLAQLLMA